MVRSLVRGTVSWCVVADRRRRRELSSVTQCRSLARYSGCGPREMLSTSRQRWKWVIYCDPWPMTITSFHHKHGTRKGRGIVVLDNPLGLESKKSSIKLKPPAMLIGLIEWASSFLMSPKNKVGPMLNSGQSLRKPKVVSLVLRIWDLQGSYFIMG